MDTAPQTRNNDIQSYNATVQRENSTSILDFLAGKIIESSGLLPYFVNHIQPHQTDNDCCFYLTVLERGLDIAHPIRDNSPKKESSSPNLFTCTDPTTSSIQNRYSDGLSSVAANSNVLPKYWSPTTPQSATNSTNKTRGKVHKSSTLIEIFDKQNVEIPSLEERAPFSPAFYGCIGHFLIYAYNPSVFKTDGIAKNVEATFSHSNNLEIQPENPQQLEFHSLYQDVDAVRATKILNALMELNVLGGKKRYYLKRKQKYEGSVCEDEDIDACKILDDDITFIDVLLHYTEGNTLIINGGHQSGNQRENMPNDQRAQKSQKRRLVPLLHSMLKHFATLPQLEGHVNTMVKCYRTDTPITKANSKPLSENEIDIKVQKMKATQIYKESLEQELRDHVFFLEKIIGLIYEKSNVNLRQKCRLKIGSFFHTFTINNRSGSFSAFGEENTSAAGIESMLRVLLRILQGISLRYDSVEKGESTKSILQESHRQLLFEILIPLHKPSGMVLWRDQTPLLGLYHKQLVQCIGVILSIDKFLIGKVIRCLLHTNIWPMEGGGKASMSNTPKSVLLLHEIDTYIGLLDLEPCNSSSTFNSPEKQDSIYQRPVQRMSDTILSLVLRLSSCIASDNSRTSERALEYFKNKHFQSLVRFHLKDVMTPLLRSLCRIESGMELPWNPTVRKMTLLVLKDLQSYNENIFRANCENIFQSDSSKNEDCDILSYPQKQVNSSSPSALNSVVLDSCHGIAPTKDMTSLRSAMGTWKPPTLTINSPESQSMPPPMSRMQTLSKESNVKTQPPLTVTGVAPWAMVGVVGQQTKMRKRSKPPAMLKSAISLPKVVEKKSQQSPIISLPSSGRGKHYRHNKNNDSGNKYQHFQQIGKPSVSHVKSSQLPNDTSVTLSEEYVESKAFLKVKEFIKKLKGPKSGDDDDSSDDGISDWSKAQMSESPVLLPNLKFHDLVFGHTLGTGAFSTVKYARQITLNKTRSYWPEYGVKIVSTQKIEELGYEKSINREIAILRMLFHPCISRLISSFRFRDGVYLVLEYASGGDLHSLLKRNGSLNENSTRFLIGEIIAALFSIHELDLVYGDLKPENVLITESGHTKLTDFGACRPLTAASKEKVKLAGRNIVGNLRDGDWRDIKHSSSPNNKEEETYITVENEVEDIRIEGTTAYLPPEVVMGSYPNKAADSWALGCVLVQCISGRPPLLGDNESSTKQKIVSFDIPSSDEVSNKDDFFTEINGLKEFTEPSRNFIRRLLNRNPIKRPSMLTASEDLFFEGMDVFNFHKKLSHRLDVGGVAPMPDAKWSRRQFSSIWAPQPEAYRIGISDSMRKVEVNPFKLQQSPIAEGEESGSCFMVNSSSMVGIVE